MKMSLIGAVADVWIVVLDVDAHLSQGRVIVRPERMKMFRIVHGGTVAPEKFVLEINADLRHQRLSVFLGRSNLQGRKQVFLAVGPYGPHGQLTARENDRLVEEIG